MTIEQSFPTGDAGSADPSDGGFATDPRKAAADAAGGSETHSEPDPSPGTGEAAPPGQSAASLLSDEEFAALRHDPVALRNAYERAARAAQDPRERALIDALRENPQATIRQLAQHVGMTVAEAEAAVEAAEGEGADPSSTREFTLPPDLQQEFTEIVGEDLAPRLVPAITKLVDRILQATVGQDLQSMRADLQARQTDAIVQQLHAEEEAFYSKRPEARQYKSAIDELSAKLGPSSDGMGTEEYLDMLLGVVLHQSGRAEGVAAERLQRGARVAATSPSRPGASPSQMRVPVGKVSFEKAADLAKRGIRISG